MFLRCLDTSLLNAEIWGRGQLWISSLPHCICQTHPAKIKDCGRNTMCRQQMSPSFWADYIEPERCVMRPSEEEEKPGFSTNTSSIYRQSNLEVNNPAVRFGDAAWPHYIPTSQRQRHMGAVSSFEVRQNPQISARWRTHNSFKVKEEGSVGTLELEPNVAECFVELLRKCARLILYVYYICNISISLHVLWFQSISINKLGAPLMTPISHWIKVKPGN